MATATILVFFSFVFACLAAAGVSAGRVSLGWLAIAVYFASLLVGPLGLR